MAFLFRHDYAVYCAIGFVTLIALSGRASWRDRVERLVAYGVITALLLGPSLWWIQRYRGLTEYVRNGLEISRAESERTGIGWPRLALNDLPSVGVGVRS